MNPTLRLALQCTALAAFNVLLAPGPALGVVGQLGLALVFAKLSGTGHLTLPQNVHGLLTGRVTWLHFATLVPCWWLGSFFSLSHKGSEPWQIVVSGLLHGFLLSMGPDRHGIFGTVTQLTWLSGMVSPVALHSWAWLFASPLVLAGSALMGMVVGWTAMPTTP